MYQRGAFIVLEGCDKAGKSTQCKKLVERLISKGIPAQHMCFPDRSTATGKLIDAYLSNKEELPDQTVHLLFSANRWEFEPYIKQKLTSGITLVVDRYSFSGIAFSAAKTNMDLRWCYYPEIGLPKPDLVLFLTLSKETMLKRAGFGHERYENTEFQERVNNNFHQLKDNSWKIVNAEESIDMIHEELLRYSLEAVKNAKNSALCTFPSTLEEN